LEFRRVLFRSLVFCPFSSLLKYSFGSSFRGARRPGASLFVGFQQGGIPCCARNGEFRSLFQQAANQASGIQSINTSAFTGTKTPVSELDPRTCIELPRLL